MWSTSPAHSIGMHMLKNKARQLHSASLLNTARKAFGVVDLGPTSELSQSLKADAVPTPRRSPTNAARSYPNNHPKPSSVNLAPANLAGRKKNSGGSGTVNMTRVDFRSDTVTVPCGNMFRSMMEAQVGDDVFEEDPTVKELERNVAALCGHEDALFCASGTMANQLAMRVHLDAMTSVICDSESHIFNYECGGVSYHAQSQLLPVVKPDGQVHMTAADVEPLIFGNNDVHFAITKGIVIENTMNGSIMPVETIRDLRFIADKHNLIMHCDGARLWNAVMASGISLTQYGSFFDSLCLSLSKGLGAPIGSVLVGGHNFIRIARHFRKLFGGGWRQAGMLAAAGLYAIEENWTGMVQDHENARLLSKGLSDMGFTIINDVETNMVFCDIASATSMPLNDLCAQLGRRNICIAGGEGTAVRFVTHLQTPRDQIERTLSTIKEILNQADVLDYDMAMGTRGVKC